MPYADYLISECKPKHGIAFMISVINCIYQDSLSSYHTEVAKLALKAHCYPHVKKIIDEVLVRFAPYTAPIDVYTYFFYSGMIWMNQKEWKKAKDSFNRVLTLPS